MRDPFVLDEYEITATIRGGFPLIVHGTLYSRGVSDDISGASVVIEVSTLRKYPATFLKLTAQEHEHLVSVWWDAYQDRERDIEYAKWADRH
jgi:hypothetical protein